MPGSRKGPHDRTRREDFYALPHLFKASAQVSDLEFNAFMGWDWENNGNKRVKRVVGYLASLGLARRVRKRDSFHISLTNKARKLGLTGCQDLHREKVRKLR